MILVAVTVLFSLLVARLLTPMMAAYLMKPHPARPERDSALMRAYTGFLRVTLRFRYLTLLIGIGLFAGSIWSTSLLPTGFIPSEDSGSRRLTYRSDAHAFAALLCGGCHSKWSHGSPLTLKGPVGHA